MRATAVLTLIAIALASPVRGDGVTRFEPVAASALTMEGSSNVAAWRCAGTAFESRMEIGATLQQINAVIDRVEDGNIGALMANPSSARFPQPLFMLRIPVAAFRCGNRLMERDLVRALRGEHNPYVDFRFTGLRGGVDHDIDQRLYRVTVRGVLSLAGAARTIDVEVSAARLSPTRFRLRAVLPLRMSEFGITPPSALLGAIHARDALRVHFDLLLDVVTGPTAEVRR